jgi:hypothetical protein
VHRLAGSGMVSDLAGSWIELGAECESLLEFSMKMRTLADTRRLAGRSARIGTVRSKAVRRRTTVPSLSSAAKNHAGAWAMPISSRTPIRICSISLVRKTPVGITRFASCPVPKIHGGARETGCNGGLTLGVPKDRSQFARVLAGMQENCRCFPHCLHPVKTPFVGTSLAISR